MLSSSCFFFSIVMYCLFFFFFFFNDTATTEIYTLSLHDALPISPLGMRPTAPRAPPATAGNIICLTASQLVCGDGDRKSTRLNSSHGYISYAVFCLKKKKKKNKHDPIT